MANNLLSLPNVRTQVPRLRKPQSPQDGFESAATAVNTIQDALDVLVGSVNTLLSASGSGGGTAGDDTGVTVMGKTVTY